MRFRLALLFGAFLLSILTLVPPASVAASPPDLDAREGVESILDLLIDKQVITEKEAVDFLGELESGTKGAEPGRFRVIDPGKGDEKTTTLPAWLERVRLSGDLRLRYQGDFFGEGNAEGLGKPGDPSEELNLTEDRHRFRYRARLGVKAQVTDELEAGMRLATGNEDDPVSTNDTLGDAFTRDTVAFDQAYLRWQPSRSVTLWGGRFPSPWFSTDLVWDSDLNFEGAALTLRRQFLGSYGAFFTAGAFPLEEVELSSHDKWLFGGQAGVQYAPSDKFSARLGAAYYHFENITGEANDPSRPGEKDYTAPRFQQKGNTLFDIDPDAATKLALAAEYRELDLLATVDVGVWDPLHVILLGEYVTNLGYDRDEVDARAGVGPEETDAYQLGLAVGHPEVKRPGDWQTFLFYKRLEADAVVDAFTDSDFHLGGTNAKGWVVGGELGLAKGVSCKARWLTADEISGPPMAIDVLQLDLSAAF